MTDSPPPHPPLVQSVVGSEEFDVRQLAHEVWSSRGRVVAMTVLGALLGVVASWASTINLSEGLFLTPGLTVADYKRYEAAFGNQPRLHEFLETGGHSGNPAAALVSRVIERPALRARAIRPEFSFTDRDARTFGVKMEEPGSLVGIRLTLEHSEAPDVAPVRLLAEYVRDTIVKIDLESFLLDACLAYGNLERAMRNEKLQADFEITQNETRAEALRAIIERTPQAASIDSRQVITLKEGDERFLSPVTQLVGAEMTIAGLRIDQAKRERDALAAAIKSRYFCEARTMLQEPAIGQAFLDKLPALQQRVFEGRDMTDSVVEHTFNELEIQRKNWLDKYFDRIRFVVAPEGAQIRVRKLGLVAGFLLGLLFGVLGGILLAALRGWWRSNRALITADDAG